MKSLAFLTPVYQRFSLTEIGFRQRRWVCDRLRDDHGIDATVIVVGDDENLDVAREYGYLTVEHPNEAVHEGKRHIALGMKFNAGYREAHRAGIDLVFPIGSDSWIDPVYFDTLPEPGELLLSRAYNLVTPDANRRGALWISWEGGVQWITHTADWEHRNYAPISEQLPKGCDTSTWMHKRKDLVIREQAHHQLEYVAFQSPLKQITDYANIMARFGLSEVTGPAVFGDLEAHYPVEHIQLIRKHYANEHLEIAEDVLGQMRRETADQEKLVEELRAERDRIAA